MHGKIDAQDRSDTCITAGQDEPHRAVETISISECQRILLERGGTLDQSHRATRAMAQRIARGHMEMDEGISHRSTAY